MLMTQISCSLDDDDDNVTTYNGTEYWFVSLIIHITYLHNVYHHKCAIMVSLM